MSRVLMYRSLVAEAITRGGRQGLLNIASVCISRSYGACEVLRQSPFKQYKQEAKLLWSVRSRFHTSSELSSEGQQASAESQEDKQESQSQRNEDFGSSHEERDVQSEPPGEGESSGESITARLRRLSMTPADEYQLSLVAQEKAMEMAKVRQEMMKNGQQWKWDQRNLRPGGPPPPPSRQQYGGYNDRRGDRFGGYGRRGNQYDDDEDDFYEDRRPQQRWSQQMRSDGDDRRSSFRDQRYDRRDEFETFDDSPDSYEVEMQKLRERLEQNKVRKAAVSKRIAGEEGESSERTARSISSSAEHKVAPTSKTNSRMGAGADFFLEQMQNPKGNFQLAASDPDTFGTLSFSTSSLVKDKIGEEIRNQLLEEEKTLSGVNEEEEEDDTRFIPPYGERWTTEKLVNKVRELLKEKKLKEAVDTYLGVLKEGGFQFDNDALRHHFNVLINECAAVGYVEMAFRLFNLMKKRGYKENPRTISSLFNACANSPWDKENNMDRIEKLLINMKDRGFYLNLIHYHALIKAYGRLGETVRAFNVVDKMIEESDLKPVVETYNMLLQACISDTKNGFRFTLVTWNKMWSSKKIRPDIYSFNLLLRAIKDCGIDMGDIDFQEKLNSVVPEVPLLPPIVTQGDSNRVLSFLTAENFSEQKSTEIVLDSMGQPVKFDAKIFLAALCYPENRLAVLGGLRGIISQMARCKVPPNLKTLTELVQVSKATDINDILQLLEAYKIPPDHKFFTAALKKCYVSNCHQTAKEVLKIMNNKYHISPNMVTWGVMALGCRSWKDGRELLTKMDATRFMPDINVLGSLLATAVHDYDPLYVLTILQEARKREVAVNEEFVLKVDDFIKRTQRGLVSREMGKPVEYPGLAKALEKNPELQSQFATLKSYYNVWIMSIDVKLYPENPWKDDFEHFKEQKRHKPVEVNDLTYEKMMNESSNTSSASA